MFYTNSDILIFDPLAFDTIKAQPNIRITNLRIFEKELAIDSFFENKHTLNLNYRQNYISFDFTPMAYLPLFAQRYEYKLTGINQDWRQVDNNFSITYTKLEPGNYTFMVRPEGVDDEVKIAELSFVITPPFWRSWWFITILSILAATSATIITRNRLNTIRRQSDMKRKILETEMAALRAQMNPHFIFNCLTAIDHLIQND